MKKLSLLSGFLLFALSGIVLSQKDEDMVNFYDGEFFLAEEDYRDALLAFKKVYDAGYEENANINYRIGVCYLSLPAEKSEAIPYLEKAVESTTENYREGSFNETQAPLDAYLFLGNAYRINYQLDEAIEAYESYIENQKNKKAKEVEFAQSEIEACKRAKVAIENPVDFTKENIGGLYNSALNNYNTVTAHNGSGLAYMSEQRFYDAVFYIEIVNGRFTNPINVTPQIESDGDQIVTALSFDGEKMLLSKISNYDADIMISNYEARRWNKSENIGKPINSKFFESHACFSPDGNTIYFTSNRNESLGGMDIFSSTMDEKGKWSEPVNLGPTINTKLNEETPFICKDGKALFFSSQGHSTIGGYDIFYSLIDEEGNWSEPIALPYPLNTTDDDLFFFPTCGEGEGVSGYMTRFEPDGFGSGDIYRVELGTQKVMAKETPVEEEPEEVVEEVVEEVIEEVVEEAPEEEVAEKPELKPVTPVVPMRQYNVKPLFFRFDSYELSSIAREKLDEIAEVLKNYPEINIAINGHTDAMGPEIYNQFLSEKRAEAAKKYLAQKGIEESRMTISGFSENEPAAINTNPDGSDSFRGRKLNRRVEFKIKANIHENVTIEPVEVPEDLKID